MDDDLKPIFPLPLWFILIATILFGCPTSASADPRYQAHSPREGLTLTLYDDLCSFGDRVTNLPYKATWRQNGEVVEGCWGKNSFPVITFFFPKDKTAFSVPAEAFEPFTGTGT